MEDALRRPRRLRVNVPSRAKQEGAATFSGIKREDVFKLVREQGRPVRAVDVAGLFAERGRETNTEAMRTALNRLVKDGRLVKPDAGTFRDAERR